MCRRDLLTDSVKVFWCCWTICHGSSGFQYLLSWDLSGGGAVLWYFFQFSFVMAFSPGHVLPAHLSQWFLCGVVLLNTPPPSDCLGFLEIYELSITLFLFKLARDFCCFILQIRIGTCPAITKPRKDDASRRLIVFSTVENGNFKVRIY